MVIHNENDEARARLVAYARQLGGPALTPRGNAARWLLREVVDAEVIEAERVVRGHRSLDDEDRTPGLIAEARERIKLLAQIRAVLERAIAKEDAA